MEEEKLYRRIRNVYGDRDLFFFFLFLYKSAAFPMNLHIAATMHIRPSGMRPKINSSNNLIDDSYLHCSFLRFMLILACDTSSDHTQFFLIFIIFLSCNKFSNLLCFQFQIIEFLYVTF